MKPWSSRKQIILKSVNLSSHPQLTLSSQNRSLSRQ